MNNETLMIHDCSVDPTRLAVLRECMGRHLPYDHPPREYEWNVISRAIAYSCGIICREGEHLTHHHNSDELERCQRLSAAVADIMINEYMVDDEGDHKFSPFYVAANEDSTVPEIVTEEVIRSAFGNLIYPPVEIIIEPLEEGTEWWSMIDDCAGGMGDDSAAEYLASWQSVIDWFHEQPELHSPVFVTIGREAIRKEDGCSGCVFPRLMIAVSNGGSLIGMFTCVTHT